MSSNNYGGKAIDGVLVSNVSTVILDQTDTAAGSARLKNIIITNEGSEKLYIAYGFDAEVGKGFIIFPDSSYEWDHRGMTTATISGIFPTITANVAVHTGK